MSSSAPHPTRSRGMQPQRAASDYESRLWPVLKRGVHALLEPTSQPVRFEVLYRAVHDCCSTGSAERLERDLMQLLLVCADAEPLAGLEARIPLVVAVFSCARIQMPVLAPARPTLR